MDNQVVAAAAAQEIMDAWITGATKTGTHWCGLYGLEPRDTDAWDRAGLPLTHPVTYRAFHDLAHNSTLVSIDHGYTRAVYQAVDSQQVLAARVVLDDLIRRCHSTAVAKGFWHGRHKDLSSQAGRWACLGGLMLVTTELAEGAEGVRNGNPPDDKVPAFDSLTAESCDAIIRLFDMAGGHGLPLADCLVVKMGFNNTREYKHGKQL